MNLLLLIIRFFFRTEISDSIQQHDIHVKKWELVYTPSNAIFEKLLKDAAESLELDGVRGVNTTGEIEDVMFKDELVAGVVFDHPAVNNFDYFRENAFI